MHNKLLVSAAVLMVAGGIYATQGVGMAAGQAAPSTAKGQIEATLTDTLKSGKKAAADTLKQRKDTTDKAKKKKDEYADLIKKGGTVKEGLFTVRHIDDKWYFEVPDSLLGRYLMCVTRYTAVPQDYGKYAGEEVNEATVYFEKHDYKTLYMRAYVLTQLADSTDRIAKTLRASTIDPIVGAFKIIGNSPKGKSCIDVTNLFMQDNKLMTSVTPSLRTAKTAGLQSDRSYIDTMKVFPINIEVATTRTYAASPSRAAAGATGAITLGMNTSIVMLPREPMRKRIWDKRVGYFASSFTRFSDAQHKTEPEAFIARYRLVPRDVKAYRAGKLVEPVKPIVYYIDPATPKKWVPYLIKGIEDWNVAFEAAGFKNAIQAKPWPNDPNMSVDDARYCVLRYLPAEIENAYGPHVSDPRSGEIIESHICWYHNVMSLLTKWYMTQCGPLDKRAQTMNFDDKLMGELIRFVSSHEVGHTLGLRHNMGASFATPVEKLRDKAWVEAHGHTASIMDYARFNYVAQPEDHVGPKGLFPRINDYDKWAIKWGYQYRPEFKDEYQEKEALMRETTQYLSNHPRCWFAGEGRDEDPRSQTEDLSDDNMRASDYGVKNLKRVLAGLPKWAHQDNDQYTDLTDMYKSVRDQFRRYTGHVLKHVGGHYLNNMPGRKPVEIAPAAMELKAVDWLGRNLFDAPLWLYPTSLTEKTAVNASTDIENQQSIALSRIVSASTLVKIYNDSYVAPGALRLDAYLDALFTAVWKPLDGRDALRDKMRRSLERNYMARINSLLNPKENSSSSGALVILLSSASGSGSSDFNANSDALLYVLQHLDKIEQFAQSQLGHSTGLDKLHYEDLLRQIKLIRDRRTTVK